MTNSTSSDSDISYPASLPEDDDVCYNCGCYGKRQEPEMWPGLYKCPNCGDEWDIYQGAPDLP